jgi:hydrogenase/urease accessory protein HupE
LSRVLLVIAGCLLFSARVDAHPVPFSFLDLRLEGEIVDGTLVVHVFDVAHELNVDVPERLLDPAYLRARAGAIVALMAARLQLSADGQIARAEWAANVEPIEDRQSIRLHVRYTLTRPAGQLGIRATLFPYDPEHRTFVNVYEGGRLTQAILEITRPELEYFAGTRQGLSAVVRKFIGAGIHHILIGPDHLLFLIGLLLLGGSISRIAVIVTGFTIAHSVTLTLAALNLFNPPSRLIEPAIALSIICVGADNLLVSNRPGARDLRALMAFAFGFIHGFGFASVLREMDLPARALGWSLLSFNVGVEIGQLLIVVPVAFGLAAIRTRSAVAGRRLAWGGSVVVIAAGVFWFAQRVFFIGGNA